MQKNTPTLKIKVGGLHKDLLVVKKVVKMKRERSK